MRINGVMYEKMPSKQDLAGWNFTMLSTPYQNVTFDNYKRFFKRKVFQTKFDVTVDKGAIKAPTPLSVPLTFKEPKRYMRSAVLEAPNGAVVIMSVGLMENWDWWKPSSPRPDFTVALDWVIPGGEFYFMQFAMEVNNG